MSGSKKKKKVKVLGLSRRGKRFRDVLVDESERSCVLIAAELINDGLEKLLRKNFSYFDIPEKFQDRLLTIDRGILGTFGARIMVSRAFNIIGERGYKALDGLREIRNHFAHFADSVSLDEPELSGCLKNIHDLADSIELGLNIPPVKTKGNATVWKEQWGGMLDDKDYTSHHRQFLESMLAIHMRLEILAKSIDMEKERETMMEYMDNLYSSE